MKQLFGEEEAKKMQHWKQPKQKKRCRSFGVSKGKRNNPGVNAITIDRSWYMKKRKHHIKARIPYHENEFIWLDKSEISWINDHKTILQVRKRKRYTVFEPGGPFS